MEKLPKRGASALELAFAAFESLHDPNRVIIDAHAFKLNLKTGEVDTKAKAFLLQHVISGAMATSIAGRATRKAFGRDKTEGTVTGVKVEDVLAAVQDIYDENKGLDHSYALTEFQEAFCQELNEIDAAKAEKPDRLN